MSVFTIENGIIFPWSSRGFIRRDIFVQLLPEPVVRLDAESLGDESSYVRFDEMVNRPRRSGFSLSVGMGL